MLTAAGLAIIAALPSVGFVTGLLISGALSFAYSTFVAPITEDILSTLVGKEMIQFFDENGDEVLGLVFPDGYPGTKHDAIKAFIEHEQSANFDLTKGHLQVDDDILNKSGSNFMFFIHQNKHITHSNYLIN